jgi:hypothetical protein
MATPSSPGPGYWGSFALIEQPLDGRNIGPRIEEHERPAGTAVDRDLFVVHVIAASGTIEDGLDRVELVHPNDDEGPVPLIIDDLDSLLGE